MAYFVVIENGRMAELFDDSVLAPPAGAVAISDEDGDMLRTVSKFGDYRLVGGAVIHDPELDPNQARQDLELAVQGNLDAAAKARGYDNIVSACSYAAVANPFQAESQAFLIWRAACWAYCYEVLAEVQDGDRAIPTQEELLAELPELSLP